jgi:hypothetical protein
MRNCPVPTSHHDNKLPSSYFPPRYETVQFLLPHDMELSSPHSPRHGTVQSPLLAIKDCPCPSSPYKELSSPFPHGMELSSSRPRNKGLPVSQFLLPPRHKTVQSILPPQQGTAQFPLPQRHGTVQFPLLTRGAARSLVPPIRNCPVPTSPRHKGLSSSYFPPR